MKKLLFIIGVVLLSSGVSTAQCTLWTEAPTIGQYLDCNGLNGSATAALSGGVLPYTYSWSQGATTRTASGLSAGTYTLTITDNSGCSASYPVVFIKLSATIASQTNILCNGSATGSASAYTSSVIARTFQYEPAVQNLSLPSAVTSATIAVTGAAGGGGVYWDGPGASFTAQCTIVPGHILSLAVGSMSPENYGGGGGGTFVYDSNTITPLAIAGGGGGAGPANDFSGGPGGTTLSSPYTATNGFGGNGTNGTAGNGGVAGAPGTTYCNTNNTPPPNYGGAGGAGWLTNGGSSGTNVTNIEYPTIGGSDRANHFTGGGGSGGYGGGGAAGVDGGGGGGGYNGGGGGNDQYQSCTQDAGGGGGGGGSYLSGTLLVSPTATNFANGVASITYITPNAGGKSPYTYSWSNGQTTLTTTGLSAGTYFLIETDNSGCTATASVTITQTPALVASISSVTNVNCHGSATGSIIGSITPVAITRFFTYEAAVQNLTIPATVTTATVSVSGAQGGAPLGVNSTVGLGASFTGICTLTPDHNLSVVVGAKGGSSFSGLGSGGGGGTFVYDSVTIIPLAIAAGGGGEDYAGDAGGAGGTTVSSPYTAISGTGGNGTNGTSGAGGSIGTGLINFEYSEGGGGGAGWLGNGSSGSGIGNFPYGGDDRANHFLGGAATNSGGDVNSGGYGGGGGGGYGGGGGGGGYNGGGGGNVSPNTFGGGILSAGGGAGGGSYLTGTLTGSAVATNTGNGSVAIIYMAPGGTSPYTYSWSAGKGTNLTATGLSAGTYTLTITDANHCTSAVSYTITQPASALGTSISTVYTASCIKPANVTANTTGGTSPYTYSWSAGVGTNQAATGLSVGTYSVTVTDVNQCTATASCTVTLPVSTLGISISTVYNEACGVNVSASINIATGGTSPYTYSWSGGGGTSSSTSALSAGTYSLSVADNGGCSVSGLVTVTNPLALALTPIVVSNVLCEGGAGSLSFNPPVVSTFSYTGTVQHYTVPAGITTATISVTGAAGGSAPGYENFSTYLGGNGAGFSGICTVNPGHVLSVVVGQQGGTLEGGGGGGGTFIYDSTLTGLHTGTPSLSALLAVAGGGGGAGDNIGYSGFIYGAGANGGVNLITNSAPVDAGNNDYAGGTGGSGGSSATLTALVGAGGAGWISNGIAASGTSYGAGGSGGADWANNFTGGSGGSGGNGGYGGGASAGAAGGGGGGYNGGGGGKEGTAGWYDGGGGGGSYLNGTAIGSPLATNTGNGTASISYAVSLGGVAPYTYSWSPGGGTASVATGLSAGIYTLTVTDVNGCSSTVSATITQPASALGISISSIPTILCNGVTGTVTATAATGGTQPYSYSWSGGGGTNLNVSSVSAGTYTITATDSHGCTATASAIITQPPFLAIHISSVSNVVCNGGIGSAIASLAYDTVVTSFSYEPAIQHLSIPPGVSTITVGLAGGAGTTVTLGAITDIGGKGASFKGVCPVLPVGHILSVAVAGAGALQNGNSGGGGGGGTFIYDSTTITLYAAAAGGGAGGNPIISISTVTGGNGGIDFINNTGTVGGYSGGGASGTGGSAGSSALPANGNPGAGWFTGDAGGGSTVRVNGFTGSGGVDGGYGGGAAGWASGGGGYNGGGGGGSYVNITQPGSGGGGGGSYLNGTVVAGTPAQTNAGNGYATISYASTPGGVPPYTYSWSGGGGTNLSATGLSAGIYTVTVTDSHGCVATASATITQVASFLGVTIPSVANVLCSVGGTATAAPTGGTLPYTYSWSGGGGTNAAASNLSAGTYSLLTTDNNGCTATASATITQSVEALGASISPLNVSCYGGTGSATVTSSGGNAPYTYSWSGGAGTNLTASNLSPGTYSITVTDNGGCTATSSTTITQPASPLGITISTVQNAACSPGAIIANMATGGVSPYTYAWIPSGGNRLSATNLSAGVYSIIAVDNNGCTAITSATITQTASVLSVTASATASIRCNGGNGGGCNATVSGGSSPFTYSWSNSATTASLSGLTAGTYTITVHDINGCLATAYVGIGQPAAISANTIVSTNITCNGGANGQAKVGVTGGYSPYTYSWSPNTNTTYLSTGLSAGIYSVTVTDKNGCTGSSVVTVTQPAIIRDSLSGITFPTCTTPTGSAAIGVKGGTSPYRYTWSPNISTTGSATGLAIRSYAVTIKDANGCTSTLTFTISQPPILRDSIVRASIVNVTCGLTNNGSATVGIKYGSFPFTYSWSPNVSSTAAASGLSVGTYSVTVSDANGCSVAASVTISQAAGLTLSAIVSANITCNGSANGQAKVTVTGGVSPYTYSWSPNSGSTYLSTELSAGTYSITVKDKNSCTNIASVTVTQPAILRDSVASITYPVIHGGTGSATIGVTGGTSPYRYTWSPSVSTTATGTGLTARTYSVQVKDANGCYNSLIFVITQPATSQGSPLILHTRDTVNKGATEQSLCCPDKDINLYPNPNSGQFTISGIGKDMLIEVYDYTGEKIITSTATRETMELNISNYPNGFYLIRILDKDGNLVSQKKVVKVR